MDESNSQKQKEKYYKSLTRRNALLYLAVFAIPSLLLYFIINFQSTSLIKNQVYNRLSESVRENLKTIKTFLDDREIDLRSYSRLKIDRIEEAERFSPFLQTLINEKKWYNFLFIADLDGNLISTINIQIDANISEREYFKVSKTGKFFISDIFNSDILGFPVMMLAHPVRNRNNQIVGVLAASLNLENFYDLLFELSIAKTSEIFLVNEEGKLLSPTKLGGRPLQDKGYSDKEQNPHTGDEGIKTHYDYRGQKVLCAYKKMPQTNFYLVSEMDLKEALLPVNKVRKIILYIIIPFFVLLVFISNAYSHRITSLLKRLTKNLESALHEARSKKKEADIINVELKKKIQESKELAQQLRLSEEYIRELIDSISLGVIGMDCNGKITHYNKEVKSLLGQASIEEDQDIFKILPWPDDKDIRAAFDNTISTHSPQRIEQKEINLGKRDEYYNLSFFPIEKNSKDLSGLSLMIENVTERKRLREQLAEYEKLSALSQLALGAAHEINNPLLGISSFLENLSEESPDKKQQEEIEFVLENVHRISETIRGLLNFARPTPPQFTKVNINHLIDETLSFLSHQPIFRKVKIEKQYSPSLSQITADLNQIRQVLINIFINAAQSMPEGGELSVKTSKVKFEEFIQIAISDTGEGITPDNMNKIFDPFFTTKKSQGTGLGLSISLSYIKNHQGTITAKSEPGQGTTFYISLPIRQKGRIVLKDEETIT